MSRITELKIRSYRGIESLDIEPKADVILIEGKNGAGKSSALGAVWSVLGGSAADPPTPIREGADSADVSITLSNGMTARKRWTAGGATITVTRETEHGPAKLPKPASLLAALVGPSIDPLAWVDAPPAEQTRQLAAIAGIDEAGYAARRAAAYDERTAVNRRVRDLEGELRAMAPVPEGTPDEEVSVSALAGRVQVAADLAADLAAEQAAERALADRIRQGVATIQRLEEQLAAARRLMADLEAQHAAALEQLSAAEPPEDTADLRRQIDAAEATNRAVRARARRREVEQRAEAARADAAALTVRIEVVDAERRAAIAAADLGIKGLSWDETGVRVQGRLIGDHSTSERLILGAQLAMASKPDLRLLCIERGESLDRATLDGFAAWCHAEDVQAWIERVRDDADELRIVEV